MDIGNDYTHSTLIYPFAQRPDVGVRVTFFLAPEGAQPVPFQHPFLLRNWDRMEEMDEPELGTKYDVKTYYSGPLPVNNPGEPCGTAAQWQGEIDYEIWLAGGYTCECPDVVLASYVSSVRCDDDSLVVDPATGDAELHLNVGNSNTWTVPQFFNELCQVDVSAAGPSAAIIFEVTGNLTGSAIDLFQIRNDGINFIVVSLDVHGVNNTTGMNLRIRQSSNAEGVQILVNALTTKASLRLQGAANSTIFAVLPDGKLLSNQTYAAATEGSIVAAMPIYDDTGTIVGYLPIYDSIT